MKRIYYFLAIFAFKYDFVLCKMPTLRVKHLSEDLVHKKRNDTLELCRMYNDFDRSLYLDYNRAAPKRLKRQVAETLVEPIHSPLDYGQVPEANMNYKDIFDLHLQMPEQIGIKKDFAPKYLEPPSFPSDSDDDLDKIPWQKHWKHGIVPYFIDSKTYDTLLSDVILKAFDYFEKATCIRLQRLRERPVDKESMQNVEWLYITNPTGIRQCVHSNENKANSGVQVITFGYDCMNRGEIIHEIMHVLGFSHEHVRADRDNYVSILWENIKPGYKKYFVTRAEDVLSHLPYDYASVMHYPPRAFSKNGHITIETRDKNKIGQRNDLSETDAEKVNYIYNGECLDRNRQYLKTTCPKVIENSAAAPRPPEPKFTFEEISQYYGDRLWKLAIVTYKFKDRMEFSVEERENIAAVIKHIQKETCIEFQDENAQLPKHHDTLALADNDYYNDHNGEDATDGVHDLDQDQENAKAAAAGKESEKNKSSIGEWIVKKADELIDKHINKTSGRRHAESIIVLERTDEPGCQCPHPGRPDGYETIQIGADCFNSANDLLHLFVHILGLDHQHNAHDRDEYLHINWDKLSPEAHEDLVDKLPQVASLGYPYDYQSVMHYPWLEIKGGVTNIMYPIWNDGWAMGHWQGLSSTDVKKLNKIYLSYCNARNDILD